MVDAARAQAALRYFEATAGAEQEVACWHAHALEAHLSKQDPCIVSSSLNIARNEKRPMHC